MHVPNVPCGVESNIKKKLVFLENVFLMYRVELKDGFPTTNLPRKIPFLMYRVELKD